MQTDTQKILNNVIFFMFIANIMKSKFHGEFLYDLSWIEEDELLIRLINKHKEVEDIVTMLFYDKKMFFDAYTRILKTIHNERTTGRIASGTATTQQ